MRLKRASGILLHPTSFPGPHGIGDLGKAAYAFVDFLVESKQSLWQILPLGPTGYGDSPYAAFSSFAGNPLLISLERLVRDGDLAADDIASPPDFPKAAVDYGWVIHWKMPLLTKAAQTFLSQGNKTRQAAFAAFCHDQAAWLDDFALFMAVKASFDQKAQAANLFGMMWSNYWEKGIALRDPKAVAGWQADRADEIAVQKVLQFFFFQQWEALRSYANERDIQIVGDIPIFVAPDSADVWANRNLFHLDAAGQATVVAGVPPDYFSPTGQLWGNPLYDWDALAETNYAWWIHRIQAAFKFVDILRIDHFRGFDAYWEIPATEKTAIKGRWVKGPGILFFEAIQAALGNLSIIAEDLGVITERVVKMRDHFGFPGMKVLQFAFNIDELGKADSTNDFLPHNYNQPCIVYTGTHDNDTTRGWYEPLTNTEKDYIRHYLGRDDHDIVWDFIRLAVASTATVSITPLQDVFDLGSSARMNTPSTLGGNWAWRYQPQMLTDWTASRLRSLVELYARDPSIWQVQEEDDDGLNN